MFVVELRGYMQDADATGELDPVGRISVHEDKNNDGVYETHHVFVDHLIFPRFVMPFGANAILAKESNADEVWKYTDTNNDSVADKKELFATGMGRLLNVEHQESGLFWALDNWIYSTINPVRLRWTPNGVLREPTGSNGGQWGATQDNYGKVWFQAGASGMPGYFQLPVAYGNFNYPEQFEPDLNITWGAPVLIADMQGGMNAVRMPDGSLARATGSAGNDVFRGDRLPKDMVGDYFYGEVVARIVRRLRPVKSEGLTQLQNVYPLSEFLRSTDPLFRPVDVTTAPDGTMYITDMYRGIIQESQWSGPGRTLRQRIDQYTLDKVVKKGRVWRLSYDGMPRRTAAPRMLSETPAQLVQASERSQWLVAGHGAAADHPFAGQVRRARAQAAGADLARSVRAHPRALDARWPGVGRRGSAARAAEARRPADSHPGHPRERDALQGGRSIVRQRLQGDGQGCRHRRRDAGAHDAQHAEGGRMARPSSPRPSKATRRRACSSSPMRCSSPAANTGRGASIMEGIRPYTADERATLDKGQEIYTQVCFACHGDDGRGAKVPGAQNEALLGPPAGLVAARARPPGLRRQGRASRAHRADRRRRVSGRHDRDGPELRRVDVGDHVLHQELVRQSRLAHLAGGCEARARGDRGAQGAVDVAELESSLPKQLVVDSRWKLTASHNTDTAINALSIQPWTSGRAQQAGMWLQVELPEPAMLTEICVRVGRRGVQDGPAVRGAPTRIGVRRRRGRSGVPAGLSGSAVDGRRHVVARRRGSGQPAPRR